jgi:hypothetical protein
MPNAPSRYMTSAPSGSFYRSPSAAARAAAGHAENGWRYWRLREGDTRLADLRTKE